MSLQSEQVNELMAALAKAQGEMTHASKDSSNPHFKSKYADLAAVWNACRIPLAKNGLAVVQQPDVAGERQVLITTLGHSSGQWIKSIIPLPIQRPGAQEMGSCLSYCRRYALASMVGVYQDDDDGEAAQMAYRDQPAEKKSPYLTTAQEKLLSVKLAKFPEGVKWIQDTFKVDHVLKINSDQLNEFLKIVAKKESETKEA